MTVIWWSLRVISCSDSHISQLVHIYEKAALWFLREGKWYFAAGNNDSIEQCKRMYCTVTYETPLGDLTQLTYIPQNKHYSLINCTQQAMQSCKLTERHIAPNEGLAFLWTTSSYL